MKTKKSLKILSFAMCLILIFLAFSVCTYAVDYEEQINSEVNEAPLTSASGEQIIGTPAPEEDTAFDIQSLKELGVGEKNLSELQEMKVIDVKIPEFIPYSKAIAKGHVNRLSAQENNTQTVIYQNTDGTKTAYLFAAPVKYVEDGEIKDKSTLLSPFNSGVYAYAMENNSAKAYFPQNAFDGIKMNYGEYDIITVPYNPKNTTSEVGWADERSVVYNGVFGENTAILYTTMLSGVKEDIYLYSYSGVNEFEFLLRADGLEAALVDGVWTLCDAEGNAIARFGEIIVTDSAGNKTLGALSISVLESGDYSMTVSVSEEFLTSPSTVYPVVIDPTTTIYETTLSVTEDTGGYTTYDSIIDVGVYDTEDDYMYGTMDSSTHYLGDVSGSGGSSKIIYKLPDFYDAWYGQFTGLNEYQIGSVYLNVRVFSGSDCTIMAYPMTEDCGTEDFAIQSTTIGNAYSTAISSATDLNGAGNYSLDITNIVKGWAKYNSGRSSQAYNNPGNGLILKLSGGTYAALKASEFSDIDTNDVYVTIDYADRGGESYIYTPDTYKFIKHPSTSTVSLAAYSNAPETEWIIQYCGYDYFVIRAKNNYNYVLYDTGSGIGIGSTSGLSLSSYKWTITASSGNFTFKSGLNHYLSYSGTSLIMSSTPKAWAVMNLDNFVPISSISLRDDWIEVGSEKYFNISTVPTNASWRSGSLYTWSTSNPSKVATTSTVSKLQGVDDGKVTLTLTHKITGQQYSFTVACGAMREGNYVLRNKENGLCLDVSSNESGALAELGEYNSNGILWNITISNDGIYTIKSVSNANYLIVEGNLNTENAAIKLNSTNSTQWYVSKTVSGAYKISKISAANMAIAAPSNSASSGADIIQTTYNQNTNYVDEWLLLSGDEASSILPNSYYTLINCNSALALTVHDASNETFVMQKSYNNEALNQLLQFEYIGTGEYRIKDVNSNKYLCVAEDSPYVNASIIATDSNSTDSSIFKIRENSDGTISLLTKSSYYTKVVGIYNALTDTDALAVQMNDDASNNVKFSLSANYIEMYLVTSKVDELGHTWIEIENRTDRNLTIGHYTMNPGERVSVGRYSSDTFDGIWYNLESHSYYNENKYRDAIYVSTVITEAEFNEISDYTRENYSGYSFFRNNCVNYAINCWHKCSLATKIADRNYKTVFIADPEELYDYFKNEKSNLDYHHLGTMFRAGAYHYYNGTQLIYIEM